MKGSLLVGSKRPPSNLLEALPAHGLELPGFPMAPEEACQRLRAGGVWVVLADATTLARPDISEALRQAGGPPVLQLGGGAPVAGSLPVSEECPASEAAAKLASMKDAWVAMAPALLAAVALELTDAAGGPLAPRVRGAIGRLAHALGAKKLALFASETGAAQILPRIAAAGDVSLLPNEICVGTEEAGLIASRREPARLGTDLLIPLTAGEHINGMLWLDAPAGTDALARSAAGLLAVALDRLTSGRGGARVTLDGDQLVWVEKLASLGQLAAGIAHEINNPLFVISGNLELVQRYLNGKPAELVEKALQAAERIRRIVYEMRQFYLPTSNSVRVAPLDVNALIASAIEVISLQAPFKGVSFDQQLEPELPEVTGDDNQLLQVLTHLFLNSAQAMPGGGVITVRTASDRQHITIEVQDHGIGIPKANQKRVFDPFFTTKQDWLGTGLGLSVSHTIVVNHGGTITLESEEGKGATFTVNLPSKPKPGEEPVAEARGKRPHRVLVADDEGTVRDFLEFLLRDLGYEVDLAPDGATALAMLEKREYGVVMMDNLMPGLSGQEIGREIVSKYPGLPVILVTGAVSLDLDELKREGFFHVLSKPCKADDIIDAVAAAVGDGKL